MSNTFDANSQTSDIEVLRAQMELDEVLIRAARNKLAHAEAQRSNTSQRSRTQPSIGKPKTKANGAGSPPGDPNPGFGPLEVSDIPSTQPYEDEFTSPIIEEQEVLPSGPASSWESNINLPTIGSLNEEALKRHQQLLGGPQHFDIHTPVLREKLELHNARRLIERAANDLQAERTAIDDKQIELIHAANVLNSELQQSANNVVMAENRLADAENRANEKYNKAESAMRFEVQEINRELAEERNRTESYFRDQFDNELKTHKGRLNQELLRDQEELVNRLNRLELQAREEAASNEEYRLLCEREASLKEERACKEAAANYEASTKEKAEQYVKNKEHELASHYKQALDTMSNDMNKKLELLTAKLEASNKSKEIELDSLRAQLAHALKAKDRAEAIAQASRTSTIAQTTAIKREPSDDKKEDKDNKGGGDDGDGDKRPPNHGRPGGSGGNDPPGGGGDGNNNNNGGDKGGKDGDPKGPTSRKAGKPGGEPPGGPDDGDDDDNASHWSAIPEHLRDEILRMVPKGRKEADKITLQSLPPPHLFRQWKITIRKSIISASICPKATWHWLMEVERDVVGFDRLVEPGEFFETLDVKLASAIDTLVKDNNSLKGDIMIKTELMAKADRMLSGRQALHMVYSYFKTDVENGMVYDIEDLIAVTLQGNNLESFLHKWDRVLLGLATEIDERTKKALFISKVKDCQAFRQEYLHYKRLDDNDPNKSYEYLYKSMKKIVEKERREFVRDSEIKALSNRHHRPAYPNTPANDNNDGGNNNNNNGGAQTPNTKGKSSGGQSRGRSASPAPRSNSARQAPNRAKVGCLYFNKGAGTCKFGDKCFFSHDPKVEIVGLANAGKGKGKGKGKRKGSGSRSASPSAGRGSRGSTPSRRSIDVTKFKTQDCKNFKQGQCTFGDKCAFKHDD